MMNFVFQVDKTSMKTSDTLKIQIKTTGPEFLGSYLFFKGVDFLYLLLVRPSVRDTASFSLFMHVMIILSISNFQVLFL